MINLKNILFLTDLDGTLLGSDKKISMTSLDILNALIDKGLKLGISTARTPATLEGILDGLKLNLPICCMNGAAYYDMKKEEYIKYFTLDCDIIYEIIKIGKNKGISPFIHCILNNFLTVCFENINSEPARIFYEERKNLRLKREVNAPYSKELGEVVYFTFLGKERGIKAIVEEIKEKGLAGRLNLNCYEDIYNKDYYFLELCNKAASKSTGLNYLKELSGAESVYAFGDNSNDMPMLMAADKSYAVENGVDEVKRYCDRVIGTNDSDSVAFEIEKIALNL